MAAFLHIIEKSGSELPTTMKYKRENVRPPSDEAKIASGFYFGSSDGEGAYLPIISKQI